MFFVTTLMVILFRMYSLLQMKRTNLIIAFGERSSGIKKTGESLKTWQHIEACNIYIDEPSGYRKAHCCETAVNLVVADWKNEMDNKNVVHCLFIDFKRSFETIDRKVLLQELNRYGVRGTELACFESYLSNREQFTKFDDKVSSTTLNDQALPPAEPV